MNRIIIAFLFILLPYYAHAQVQCEDTCKHIHGIDISHYQRTVFWETLGDNAKMAYVYIKATEGGTHIDSRYKNNIDMAHEHGLKVGSYHFIGQRPRSRNSWTTFSPNAGQKTKTSCP